MSFISGINVCSDSVVWRNFASCCAAEIWNWPSTTPSSSCASVREMIASTCSCVAPITVFIDCARRVSLALASLNSADSEPKALSMPRMRVSMPRNASTAWLKFRSLSPSSFASDAVVPSTFFRFSASFARIWKVLTSPSSLKVIVAVEPLIFVYLFTITYIVNDNQICYDHADVHITVYLQIRGHVILGKTLGSLQNLSCSVPLRFTVLPFRRSYSLGILQVRSLEN